MPNMIYYHPIEKIPGYKSGSTLRPEKMKQGFKNIGYDVFSVEGSAKDRRTIIKEIKEHIKRGAKFDFVYIESINIPVALSDRNHKKVHPFLDFNFLSYLKNQNIEIGIFYRDIFWVFDSYKKAVPIYKRMITLPFFRRELRRFVDLSKYFFLPSIEMAEYFPIKIESSKVVPLPAGFDEKLYNITEETSDKTKASFNLAYIGNVLPPEHDIKNILSCANKLSKGKKDNIKITVITNKEDYISGKEYYKSLDWDIDKMKNVTVLHLWGDELKQVSGQFDIGLLLLNKCEYLTFAMPIKLFEYVGMGLPIITNKDTAYGKYIEKNQIGWAIDEDGLYDLIEYLHKNPEEFQEKRRNLLSFRMKNTWDERCRFVAKLLSE